MSRKLSALLLVTSLTLAGCNEAGKSIAPNVLSSNRIPPEALPSPIPKPEPELRGGAEATPQRHIAVRQFLVIQSAHDQVELMQKAAIEKCRPPTCELLESTFTRRNEHQPARATMRLRIQPDALPAFLIDATHGGEIIEQRTESEDKTDEVIDVEARLRNLNALRERLRKLLKSEGAKLKDVIEIERELARVQTELESAEGQRKRLAAETTRTTVSLEWRARRSVAESGTFNTLGQALRESGRTLAESLAALVTFLIAVLPWAITLGILALPVRAWWRRRKANRQQP